jgi:hypothetical protein
MLFMGEEFACDRPFQFFVDFGDEPLREAVVRGRREEYPQHDWSGGISPVAALAFESSRIGLCESGDAGMRAWYRQLLQLRRQWRSSGLLADRHIIVETDIERGFFCFGYEQEATAVLVAVRLCPSDAPSDVIPCRLKDPRLAALLDASLLQADSRDFEAAAERFLADHAKIFVR